MQYTGLKDINGQEIYEGDILYYTCEDEWAEVEYNNGKFNAVFDTWNIDLAEITDEVEVRGNIYENKELIRNENK